ncbi:hypothetical protein ACWJJH_21385 [Endozoicomonadaceae bacterium StTr2]
MSNNCLSRKPDKTGYPDHGISNNTENDFSASCSQLADNLFLSFSCWVTGVSNLDKKLGDAFKKELITKHGYSTFDKTLTEFQLLGNSSDHDIESYNQFRINNLDLIKSVLFIWFTGDFQYHNPSENIKALAYCRGIQWAAMGINAPTLPEPDWDKIPDSQGQNQ